MCIREVLVLRVCLARNDILRVSIVCDVIDRRLFPCARTPLLCRVFYSYLARRSGSIQLSYQGSTLILDHTVFLFTFFIYIFYLHLFVNQKRYASTFGQCRYVVSVVFLSRLCCPQLSSHTISGKMLSAFGHP